MIEQERKPDAISPIQRDILKIGIGEGAMTFREISGKLKDELSTEDLDRMLRALEDNGLLEKHWSLSPQAKTLLGGESRDLIVETSPIPLVPARKRRVLAGPIVRRIDPQLIIQKSRVEKPIIAPVQPIDLGTKTADQSVSKEPDKRELRLLGHDVDDTVKVMKAKRRPELIISKEGDKQIILLSTGELRKRVKGEEDKPLTLSQALVEIGSKKLSQDLNKVVYELSRR